MLSPILSRKIMRSMERCFGVISRCPCCVIIYLDANYDLVSDAEGECVVGWDRREDWCGEVYLF